MSRRVQKDAISPVRRVGKILYRTLVALSALVVVLYVGYRLAAKEPTMAPTPTIAPAHPDTPNGITPLEGVATTWERREGTFTFLLAAEDQESGNADTMMVVTFDTKNHKVGVVSIPRDTLVVEGKLNSIYHKGADALRDKLSDLLGIPIDYYVTVRMRGLVKLIDSVGGIDFDVPVRMAYDAPDQNLYIHFEKGMQHLSGADVIKVARCRNNSDQDKPYPHNLYPVYPDGDIGRTRTQQQLLLAIVKKALSNPQKFPTYVDILVDNVGTDLEGSEILWLMEPALAVDFSTDVETATLPGDGNTSYRGWGDWCYQLYPEETLEIVNRLINPYTIDLTADKLNIFQVN